MPDAGRRVALQELTAHGCKQVSVKMLTSARESAATCYLCASSYVQRAHDCCVSIGPEGMRSTAKEKS